MNHRVEVEIFNHNILDEDEPDSSQSTIQVNWDAICEKWGESERWGNEVDTASKGIATVPSKKAEDEKAKPGIRAKVGTQGENGDRSCVLL